MQFGITIPNFGSFGNAATLADLARSAEANGWDGCFNWDHLRAFKDATPLADPWLSATAMALATERIRIGPLVTPLPRRRPWQVARQAVTLDHLSNGRLIFGVGIGGDWEREYSAFNEDPDQKRHGAMLDEALTIIDGLWSGEPFTFSGEHYQVDNVRFLPKPVQQPRIPIWVAGVWPRRTPFRRAARWDGAFPIVERESFAATAEDIHSLREFIAEHRTSAEPFDIAIHAESRKKTAAEVASEVDALAAAGATWWLQTVDPTDSLSEIQSIIASGPPNPRKHNHQPS